MSLQYAQRTFLRFFSRNNETGRGLIAVGGGAGVDAGAADSAKGTRGPTAQRRRRRRRHGLVQPAAHAGATKGARTLTRRREGEAPPRGAGCCARACTVCAPQECSRRWRLLRSCSNYQRWYVAATSIQEKTHARDRTHVTVTCDTRTTAVLSKVQRATNDSAPPPACLELRHRNKP